MKRIIILILITLIVISSVSAIELCEYNSIKTRFDYPHQEEGKKVEYKDEKFVMMVDKKVINNLEQLKGLTCLEFADFYHEEISGDLETLKDLTNLKLLSLHTNPEVYGDICALSKATKLKSLKFAFDEEVYGDISCLKDLKDMETFAMTYTKLSGDLSDFSHMKNLKALYLSGTDVSGDVSALSGLINLEELTLSDSEIYDSEFHGDLASLDNLKKLRKVALYNMDVTNCEHFHETHPNIEEGGCSAESAATMKSPNIESEKIIGKEGPGEGPPEECIKDGKFIGEEECRDLMDERYGRMPERTGPQEMVTSGGFFKRIIDWFIGLFR